MTHELNVDHVVVLGRVFKEINRQSDLAREMKVRESTISAMKKRGKVSLEMLLAASRLTGKSMEFFLYGDERAGGDISARVRLNVKEQVGSVDAMIRETMAEYRGFLDRPGVMDSEEGLRRRVRGLELRLEMLQPLFGLLELRLDQIEGMLEGERVPGKKEGS